MAITANPTIGSSPNATLDAFLQKDSNSIGSWADQCDEGAYCNSMNSEDNYDLSFGNDSEGWNKVKSKSERLESKTTKPFVEDRFRKYRFPKYRYKTSQYFASRYMQQRKLNEDSETLNKCEYSPKPNQCNSDLHSNSDCGDSDTKQDAKDKAEFVDAPVPKVNPWSKSNNTKNSNKEMCSRSPVSKIERHTNFRPPHKLPPSCGWGKGSNSSITPSKQIAKPTPESPKDQHTWPTLDEVSSPKSTISTEKQSPESLSSLCSSAKITKKKTKQRTKSDRNKTNSLAKLDLEDSDSSKDNDADTSSSISARRKKGRQRWTTLEVDLKTKRNYSYPQRKYRPRQYERDFDRSYSTGNDRPRSENEPGNRKWNNSNGSRFNRRRIKSKGKFQSKGQETYNEHGQDGYGFDEIQFINGELSPSQLVMFDAYPQCAGLIDGDVQVFIPGENYAPTLEYVQWQIEYYFSPSNLKGDFFLRRRMDKNGFVLISLIANFRAILNLTNDIQVVYEAIKGSSMLEMDGDKVRCREEPAKWVMEGGDHTDDFAHYNFASMPGYDPAIVSPDSEEQFSTVSYDSACYVLDETLCQYQAAEEINEDLLSRSEMWKWVDVPVFIPKKSANAGQDLEKLSHSELSEADDVTGNSTDKQSDSGVSGSISLSEERVISSSLPDLKATCESKVERHLTSRLRKTSLEQDVSNFDVKTTSSTSNCNDSASSNHRQLSVEET